MSRKIKIAWGVDPSNSSEEIDENIRWFFKSLSKSCDIEIYPVHITSASYSIYGQYSESVEPIDFSPYIRSEAEAYLESFKDFNFNSLELLENISGFRRSETILFSNFVKNKNCDFALLASQGRKGLSRMFLGSFTENYLLQSTCPTFVINPNVDREVDLSYALAPVELDGSAESFLADILDSESLPFLKKISFFHSVNSKDFEDQDWTPELYTPDHHDFKYFVEKAQKKSEIFLSNLVEKFNSDKILHYAVTKDYKELEESIIGEAKKLGAGLIVLKSNSTALNSLFIGSLSKKLIRDSNRPVLVYPVKHQF